MINVINPERLDYHEANIIAGEVMQKLIPHCDIIAIAGSLRRKQSIVGDVEIICLPKMELTYEGVKIKGTAPNLFDDIEAATNTKSVNQILQAIPEFMSIVNSWEKVKGEPNGRYTQRILDNGVKLDLFMPLNIDYYRQYAIRTGSAEYSRFVIAGGWKKKGWCGTENGLRLISECEQKSNKWICMRENPTLPPVWQSEKEFFEFIEVRMLPPEYRNVNGR